ncbi:hypothetical protein QN277_024252 [Acacia crassicarpa]|uniref:Uncharacterized protein n=1 Tax=Acacia crassicarpa TaxID=499986 RepID=A0AAE1MNV3_9FABA|nr:hypothetical protein QN277_024252 [Acacia crassicarpa]
MLYVVLQFHYSDTSIYMASKCRHPSGPLFFSFCSGVLGAAIGFQIFFSYITPAHAVSHLKKLVQHDGWQFLVNCEFFLQFGF